MEPKKLEGLWPLLVTDDARSGLSVIMGVTGAE